MHSVPLSLLFISLTLYSTHSRLFAKTILSPWEWTRHSHQCFSTLRVNKTGLSNFPPSTTRSALSSALSPVTSQGGEMLSHSTSPSQVPLLPAFPYYRVCPTQEAWFWSHGYREGYKLNNNAGTPPIPPISLNITCALHPILLTQFNSWALFLPLFLLQPSCLCLLLPRTSAVC